MLELLAITIIAPNRPIIMSSGNSQYFLLFFRNCHSVVVTVIVIAPLKELVEK